MAFGTTPTTTTAISSGGSATATYATNGTVAAPTLLVATFHNGQSGSAISTFTDSDGGVWTTLSDIANPGNCRVTVYARISTTTGTGKTLTVAASGAGTTSRLTIEEWTGAGSTLVADATAVTATGTGTSPSVPITPGTSGSLIIGAAVVGTAQTFTVGGGLTNNATGTTGRSGSGYKASGVTGGTAVTPTLTISASTTYAATSVAIQLTPIATVNTSSGFMVAV